MPNNMSNMSELARMTNKQKADIYQEFLNEALPTSLEQLESLKNKYLNRLQSLSDIFKILPESEKAFITAEIHFVINEISTKIDKRTLEILNEQNKKEKLDNKKVTAKESNTMSKVSQTYISLIDYLSDITFFTLKQVRTTNELNEVIDAINVGVENYKREIAAFPDRIDREKVTACLNGFVNKFRNATKTMLISMAEQEIEKQNLKKKDEPSSKKDTAYDLNKADGVDLFSRIFNEISSGKYDKKPVEKMASPYKEPLHKEPLCKEPRKQMDCDCSDLSDCCDSCRAQINKTSKIDFRIHSGLGIAFDKKKSNVAGLPDEYIIETTLYDYDKPVNTQTYRLDRTDIEQLIEQLDNLLARS